MKPIVSAVFLLLSLTSFSQKKEMVDYFHKGEFDKSIELAEKILVSEPNDFETILMLAKAQNEKANFTAAIPYLEKAQNLMTEDWQKSWALLEISKNNFALGNIDLAKKNYGDALQINGTKNSIKELKKFGMLSGLDTFYKDWKIRESNDIIFHFENTISAEDIERIVRTRQKAFEEINGFFNSKLPKKIDFFVWNQKENYNPNLDKSLGFTISNLTISHNLINQTPGHEIAHNISFWSNIDNTRNKFINEGIGVCFDLQKNDKLKIAQEVYAKNPIDIKEIWKNKTPLNDTILYPISGAFVRFLVDYDQHKLLQLAVHQSYESAEKIYNGKIDTLIENFTQTLKK